MNKKPHSIQQTDDPCIQATYKHKEGCACPLRPGLLPEPTCAFPCLHVHIQYFYMNFAVSEVCHFYVLLSAIYLSNVSLLPHTTGEMTKVKTRSMDPTEDSSVLTIAYFEKKFADMESSFSALLQEKNNEVSSLKDKVKSLEDKVQALQNNIEENEAYERRDSLIFSGSLIPTSTSGEICINLVKEMVVNKLSLNISASDMELM